MRNVLFMALMGLLFPACGGDESKPPGSGSEGEGSSEGEGEGSHAEGEGEGAVGDEGEGHTGEGEGEGPVCACDSNTNCDDGNFCNGAEVCANCACGSGTPPTCADEFDCTDDRCANNTCVNVPAHARCGAGKICRPVEGGCVAPPPCRDDADCVLDDPCQTGACDAATRACAFTQFDGDEDGHAPIICGGDDCNDSTSAIHPGREEECNEQDDNCDGQVDEDFNLATDNMNCGGCRIVCPADSSACHDSQCVCRDGFTDCNGSCVNLAISHGACGRCGNECPEMQDCQNGMCRCPEPGYELCEGECVGIESNQNHCGRCGNECHRALTCRGGACVCPDGGQLCGDFCDDITRDVFNCGACGNECPVDADCVAGTCICQDEHFTACPGVGCVNLQENPEHCGTCDAVCEKNLADEFQVSTCITGVCQCFFTERLACGPDPGFCQQQYDADWRCLADLCATPTSSIECDAQCIDITNNIEHCGRCDNACGENDICADGRCEACPHGTTRCADFFGIALYCADLQNDPANCDGCGVFCESAEVCTGGVCVCDDTCQRDEDCAGADPPEQCLTTIDGCRICGVL